MQNYKVYWSPSLCKKLKQFDNNFWRKWLKTSFSAICGIFTGMPKACQIFPAQTAYAKSWTLLASITMQKFRWILWPVFEKMAKNLIFEHFWPYLGMPKECKIFFLKSGFVSLLTLGWLVIIQNFRKIPHTYMGRLR